MIKYKNNVGLGTESFVTKMRDLDVSIKQKLSAIDRENVDYDINVEEIIINSLYEPESSSSYATEKQNVTILYTLIKENKKVQI